jgi:recombination protein RecA
MSFDEFVEKHFGAGVIVSAETLVERPRPIIPTVLSLDVALTGGIPDGKVVLISGRPKSGKTTLCGHILANAIAMGRQGFYADIECRGEGVLTTIPHLDRAKLKFFKSTREKQLSAQAWFHLLERTVKDNPGCMVVVDSVAMLSTLAEQAEATGDNHDMAGVPKLLANFFRKIKDVVDTNNCVMIFISQYQTNRDPMSKRKYDEKGGLAIQYACSVWMEATWFQVWQKDAATQESYGQDVHFTIKASALGKPYRPCVLPLRFGEGIDQAREIATFGENLGLIEKAGAWYSIPMLADGKAVPKFQGGEQLRAFLMQNPDKMYAMERKIREIVIPNSVPYADQVAQRRCGQAQSREIPAKAEG